MSSGQRSSKGPKISPKMKKGIGAIEVILGIEYEGKSFTDAQKFLEENLPKIKDKDIRDYIPPSDKMLRGIEVIRSTLGIGFNGTTMKEASEFLEEHLEEALSKLGSRGKK